MTPFPVAILTPTGSVFEGPAQALSLPGADGRFGVLAGHAPLLAVLVPGVLDLRTAAGPRRFRCGAGVFQTGPRGAVILADTLTPEDRPAAVAAS